MHAISESVAIKFRFVLSNHQSTIKFSYPDLYKSCLTMVHDIL